MTPLDLYVVTSHNPNSGVANRVLGVFPSQRDAFRKVRSRYGTLKWLPDMTEEAAFEAYRFQPGKKPVTVRVTAVRIHITELRIGGYLD